MRVFLCLGRTLNGKNEVKKMSGIEVIKVGKAKYKKRSVISELIKIIIFLNFRKL